MEKGKVLPLLILPVIWEMQNWMGCSNNMNRKFRDGLTQLTI